MFQIVFQGLIAGALRILWKKSLRSSFLLVSQESRMGKGRASQWWLMMVTTFDLLPMPISATKVELWDKDTGFLKSVIMYKNRRRQRMEDLTQLQRWRSSNQWQNRISQFTRDSIKEKVMMMPSSMEKREPQRKPQRYVTVVRVFKQQNWKHRGDLVMPLSRKTCGVHKADLTPNSAVISKSLGTLVSQGADPCICSSNLTRFFSWHSRWDTCRLALQVPILSINSELAILKYGS